MIKWILKHYRLFAFTAIVALLIANELCVYHKNQYSNQSLLQTPIITIEILSLFAIALFCLVFATNVRHEYIYNDNWKEIYTSYGDYYVSLTLTNCIIDDTKMYIDPDLSRLGNVYSKFKKLIRRKKIIQGSITISRSPFNKETRTFNLQSKNIIIEGIFNQNSRITKIEYAPALKMKHVLFGYSSEELDSNVDGELRITISQNDSCQKEHSLFGD